MSSYTNIWLIAIYVVTVMNGCGLHQDLKEIKQEIVKLQEVRK